MPSGHPQPPRRTCDTDSPYAVWRGARLAVRLAVGLTHRSYRSRFAAGSLSCFAATVSM